MSEKDDEDSEFIRAMRGVTPLGDDNKVHTHRPTPTSRSALRPCKETPSSFVPFLSDHQPYPVEPDTTLNYAQAGIQPKDLRALRLGQLHVDGEIDLHGLHTDAARELFSDFIERHYQRGDRVLRIIHGRGKQRHPRLKNCVDTWLRQIPMVIAYHSCPPNQGGTGAVFVMLQRRR